MRRGWKISCIPVYAMVFMGLMMITLLTDRAVTVMSGSVSKGGHTVVIDAGHGGVDGGATSCTGVLESSINLEIALRLEDMFRLLGYKTRMIRTQDISVYTEGETIAAKKVSDLKERLRMIAETETPLVVSIHQNYFSDGRYKGAQVFYPTTDGSEVLAKKLQETFLETLNRGSNRQAKKSTGIYLMEHIRCTGVLVECGFLSNPQEEALLRSSEYQMKLCAVIAAACAGYLNT